MFSNIGSGELIIIGIIVLLLFGSKKLKELGRGLGEASRELRKIQEDKEVTEE
jgi:sec-independent protein translocase protein TatA